MRDTFSMNTTRRPSNQCNSIAAVFFRGHKGGFSLIELMVVLAIIALLATAVGLSKKGTLAGAKRKAAIGDIKVIKSALEVYDTDQGTYPTMQQGLMALASKPTIPPVPAYYPSESYLDNKKIPMDPWGNEYYYLSPGRNGEPYEIISYGKDRRPGGEGDNADISSSEL